MQPRRTPVRHSVRHRIGVVVDVADDRSSASGSTAPVDRIRSHRRAGHRRRQLDRVGVVPHHREVLAGCADLLEEAQQVVGVVVGDESLRPVGHRLGADPDRGDRIHLEQWLDVPAQHPGLHDHRVAAGEQHIGDLGMLGEVGEQAAGLRGGEAQFLGSDELGPAEAEGAVGVTGLSPVGEEQDRLAVLVLDPGERDTAHRRHIGGHLLRRMGIQFADGSHRRPPRPPRGRPRRRAMRRSGRSARDRACPPEGRSTGRSDRRGCGPSR